MEEKFSQLLIVTRNSRNNKDFGVDFASTDSKLSKSLKIQNFKHIVSNHSQFKHSSSARYSPTISNLLISKTQTCSLSCFVFLAQARQKWTFPLRCTVHCVQCASANQTCFIHLKILSKSWRDGKCLQVEVQYVVFPFD